jgi:gamma-glutamyltranspeptidase
MTPIAASGSRFAIASPHAAATEAGLDALDRGGNAVDAALCAACLLSVVYPHMCGPGGDLFAIVVEPGAKTSCINSSGAAAAAVDVAGLRTSGEMPTTGPLTITVPGAVAGWALLSRSGRLGLEDALRPAIDAARSGTAVAPGLARALAEAAPRLRPDAGMRALFFPDDHPLQEGDVLIQGALADTLEGIAQEGSAAMGGGSIGAELVAGLRRLGSPLQASDLEGHVPDVAVPLAGSYRDWGISTAPPNSQGFVLLLALALVERLGVEPDPLGPDASTVAAIFELCNTERDRHLCDPRFTGVDLRFMLNDAYIESLVATVRNDRIASAPRASPRAGGDTIAVVAADSEGWAVSLIQSLFHSFGAGILEPATGIIAHNRGASFSLDEESPNLLVPGKRPAHTLMPVVVHRGGRLAAVTGTMGGRAQPQIHAQVLMRLLDGGLDPALAVDAPRWTVGAQDEGAPRHPLFIEARASHVIDALKATGRDVRVLPPRSDEAGHYQAITITRDGFSVAADPRSDGAAAAR